MKMRVNCVLSGYATRLTKRNIITTSVTSNVCSVQHDIIDAFLS